MKTLLAVIFLISPALAQNESGPGVARTTAACGPAETHFDVKVNSNEHPLPVADPDKALVVVAEDQETKFVRDVTIRVAVDGAWMGANRGKSYFFFAVNPGTRHVCADWETSNGPDERIIALTNFTAEAGKIYYFRARTWGSFTSQGSGNAASNQRSNWVLDLDPISDDQGQYIVATSGVSSSRPKK